MEGNCNKIAKVWNGKYFYYSHYAVLFTFKKSMLTQEQKLCIYCVVVESNARASLSIYYYNKYTDHASSCFPYCIFIAQLQNRINKQQ